MKLLYLWWFDELQRGFWIRGEYDPPLARWVFWYSTYIANEEATHVVRLHHNVLHHVYNLRLQWT